MEGGGNLTSKDCSRKNVSFFDCFCFYFVNSPLLNQQIVVKNLMYGFGDDRNPASDTVNVMEEILIEYITDVVRYLPFASFLLFTL